MCRLSVEDRDSQLAVSEDGLVAQARMEKIWAGGRSSLGVRGPGRYQFEAIVEDEGLCRVGWSTPAGKLDLGTCRNGFGFGGTGKKSNERKFEDYGEPYGLNDVIGCLVDFDKGEIAFSKNGVFFGEAFRLPAAAAQGKVTLYPAVVLKNAQMRFNFGAAPFSFPAPGFVAIANAPPQNIVSAEASSSAGNANNNNNNNNGKS